MSKGERENRSNKNVPIPVNARDQTARDGVVQALHRRAVAPIKLIFVRKDVVVSDIRIHGAIEDVNYRLSGRHYRTWSSVKIIMKDKKKGLTPNVRVSLQSGDRSSRSSRSSTTRGRSGDGSRTGRGMNDRAHGFAARGRSTTRVRGRFLVWSGHFAEEPRKSSQPFIRQSGARETYTL